MGWVLSVILAVVLVVVVAILGRRIVRLRRQLDASTDQTVPEGNHAGPAGVIVGPTDGAVVPTDDAAEPTGGAVVPTDDAGEPTGVSFSPTVGDAPTVSAAPPVPPVPLPPGPGNDEDRRLPSLWALTVLEQERQWHLGLAAGVAEPGGAPPAELDGVLAVEVERIREEVGTPGSLDARVDPPVSSGDAALIFHATRQLLGLLVPHTQAFDLSVGRAGDEVVLELTCSGWEGAAHLADGVGRLLEAVAPAGGDLELDTLSDERLQATLRLPTQQTSRPR